jgi:hypothetical protein
VIKLFVLDSIKLGDYIMFFFLGAGLQCASRVRIISVYGKAPKEAMSFNEPNKPAPFVIPGGYLVEESMKKNECILAAE